MSTDYELQKEPEITTYDLFVKQMKLIGCQSLLHPFKRIKSHHVRAGAAEAMSNICVFEVFLLFLVYFKKIQNSG